MGAGRTRLTPATKVINLSFPTKKSYYCFIFAFNSKILQMDQVKHSKFIAAGTFAVIIGGVLILYTLIIDFAGARFTTFNMIALYVLEAAGLSYALISYRKEYRENIISYGQAFAFGTLVALILSLILVIFNFIYTQWINPDIVQMSRDYTEQKLLERGLSEDMIEMQLQFMDRFKSPVFTIISGFIVNMVVFSIINLIVAGFVKREPTDPFANIEDN